MICRKHDVEMAVVHAGSDEPFTASLSRCPVCTEEFRAALTKAKSLPKLHSKRQRVLPPVMMSERWP